MNLLDFISFSYCVRVDQEDWRWATGPSPITGGGWGFEAYENQGDSRLIRSRPMLSPAPRVGGTGKSGDEGKSVASIRDEMAGLAVQSKRLNAILLLQ
jgi:hypothetical protein